MNKCEKLKMQHAWKDVTPNIVYPTNPPQFPPRTEECPNCGLSRTFREKTERWIEYSDGKTRPTQMPDGSMVILADDLSNTGVSSTALNILPNTTGKIKLSDAEEAGGE